MYRGNTVKITSYKVTEADEFGGHFARLTVKVGALRLSGVICAFLPPDRIIISARCQRLPFALTDQCHEELLNAIANAVRDAIPEVPKKLAVLGTETPLLAPGLRETRRRAVAR